MGIKKRVLIFVTLFGIGAGLSAILFNQLFLKNALVAIQEQQVRTSFKLSQLRINNLFSEMEQASRNLALFGSEIYEARNLRSVNAAERVINQHLTKVFTRHKQSIGGGIWFEPYQFDPHREWFGPYVYKHDDEIVFTWDLSTPEYNYHNHDWYRIAFASGALFDEQVYWSQPYFDDAGSFEYMMTATAPLTNSVGQKVGVATVDWAIKHLVEALESVEFTENASSLLLNKLSRRYLSFPDNPESHPNEVQENTWESEMIEKANGQELSKIENITFQGQTGSVYFIEARQNLVLGVFLPDSDYLQHINRFTSINLFLSVFVLLIFLLALAFMLRRLFSPLNELIDGIQSSVSFSEESNSIQVNTIKDIGIKEFTPVIQIMNRVYTQIKDYTLQIEQKNITLGEQQEQINELNAHLEQKVDERTHALEHKTQEAVRLVGELKATQQQMIEMEKNAALGQLVTGIAHEVNTPVGVCVTAMSILQEQQAKIQDDLNNDQLTKPELVFFLEHIDEVSEVLRFNLGRTKELIESFKQISADQSVEESRVFNLGDYIQVIISSLRLTLKQEKVVIRLSIPADLNIDCYPGILSQIMNNLVDNSIKHAFSGQGDKQISIEVSMLDAENIRLTYADNGSGMEREVKNRIFEPFFTTRRGQGGTGLGMHITYNLITQKLRGRVTVESEPGQGARFIIDLPVAENN